MPGRLGEGEEGMGEDSLMKEVFCCGSQSATVNSDRPPFIALSLSAGGCPSHVHVPNRNSQCQ